MPPTTTPPTVLEHALLGLVAREPRSGYDLRQVFEHTLMRQFSPSPGSIYPALRRLAARRLLGSVVVHRGRRARRVYRLTREGMAALRRWVLAPVTIEELRADGRTAPLRFSMIALVTRSATGAARADHEFLQSYADAVAPYLDELRALARAFGNDPDPRLRLALLHGIEQVRGQQRWLAMATRGLAGSGHTSDP